VRFARACERTGGACGRLGWYGSGLRILLDVARGLAFLHNRRVRPVAARRARAGTEIACPSCPAAAEELWADSEDWQAPPSAPPARPPPPLLAATPAAARAILHGGRRQHAFTQ